MHPVFRPNAANAANPIPAHEITRLHVLAEESARRAKSTRSPRHLYVIRLERRHPSIDFDFYVGQTGRTPEIRLEQHRTGYKAAKCFRRGRALARGLSYDLMWELPRFFDDDSAKQAEKLLTQIITTYVGPAHCN